MLQQILLSLVLGSSFILGQALYKVTRVEVDPFIKKHKIIKNCAKYLEIQAILWGIALSILIQYTLILSLIIFIDGIVKSSLLLNKKKKYYNFRPSMAFILAYLITTILISIT